MLHEVPDLKRQKEYMRELDHVLRVILPAMMEDAETKRMVGGPIEEGWFEHGLYRVLYVYLECDDGPQIIHVFKNDAIFSEAFMDDLHLKYELELARDMMNQIVEMEKK